MDQYRIENINKIHMFSVLRNFVLCISTYVLL